MTESVPCSHWIGPFPLFRKKGGQQVLPISTTPLRRPRRPKKTKKTIAQKQTSIRTFTTGCVAAAVQQHPTGEYTLARERPPLIYRNPTRGSIDSAYLAASRPLAIGSPPLGTTPSPIRKLSHQGTVGLDPAIRFS